jgi:hypothetical protein
MYFLIWKNVRSNIFVGAATPQVFSRIEEANEEAESRARNAPGWEFIVCSFRASYTNVPDILVKAYN